MNNKTLLKIRLEMEALISEREGMLALNTYRERRGEAQGYDDGCFYENSEAFTKLVQKLDNIGGN